MQVYIRHASMTEAKHFTDVEGIDELNRTLAFLKNEGISYEGDTYRNFDKQVTLDDAEGCYVELIFD